MFTKEYLTISFLIFSLIWIYLLINSKITGAELSWLLIATAIALVLVYNAGNIKSLAYDFQANKLLAEMKGINEELYAKVEIVKQIGENVADISAFTVTSVGRFAPDNLKEIMLAERDKLNNLLREIGSSSEKIKETSTIIEKRVASDLVDDIIQPIFREISQKKIKNGEQVDSNQISQELRSYFKNYTEEELNIFLKFLKEENINKNIVQKEIQRLQNFLNTGKLSL